MSQRGLHLNGRLQVEAGQHTEPGVKAENEDCIGIRIPDEPQLTLKGIVAVIADGVSAAQAGKEASETCVRNFISDYYSTPDSWSVKTAGHKVLSALNRWLYGQSQHYIEASHGYVSTFSCLVIKSRLVHVFHAGDTRIYRLRDQVLEQLTRDHTAQISQDQAYLARAMGMDSNLEVDYRVLDVREGDLFLLTSDGVHDVVPHKRLQELAQTVGEDLEQAARALVTESLSAGSQDNLSCQWLRVSTLPPENDQDVYQKLSELSFPVPLEVGQCLDGYRVLKELHASSRSQTYVVEDDTTHQRYVMKTPSPNFEDDPAYIERFIMEEWLGKRIDSVYVCKVYEPRRRRSCLYTLMEYVQGTTLTQWIKEHPKPEIQEVIRLVEMISRGLRAFHRRDMLHQDIKPDNIIIQASGVPKIIDFGACVAGGIAEITTPFQRDIALGTLDYSAPEVFLQQQSSVKSELFALAVVTYEMLTSAYPYGKQLQQLQNVRQLNKLQYYPAYHSNPLIPVWIDGALKKALQPRPESRHSALSEFIFELQTPNPQYLRAPRLPLIQRNPVRVWQMIALIEALLLVAVLVL